MRRILLALALALALALLPPVCAASGTVAFDRIDRLLAQLPRTQALLRRSLVLPGGAQADVRLGPQFKHLSAEPLGPYAFEARLKDGAAGETVAVTLCTRAEFLDAAGHAVADGSGREFEAVRVEEHLVAVLLRDTGDEAGAVCP